MYQKQEWMAHHTHQKPFTKLLRYSRECQSNPLNYLDRKDCQFKKLYGTCDSVFHALSEQGIGADKKSARILTKADKAKIGHYFDRGPSKSSIFLC